MRDRDLKRIYIVAKGLPSIRKLVSRCALLSKSSTKLTLEQTVSMDFKIAFQQRMVPYNSSMYPNLQSKMPNCAFYPQLAILSVSFFIYCLTLLHLKYAVSSMPDLQVREMGIFVTVHVFLL